MKQILIYIFFGTALALHAPACQQEAKQPPLSDKQVSRIMADLYLAEAATTGLTGNPKDSLLGVYYRQVFEIHGVSKEDYETSLRTMSEDDERIRGVVDSAINLLKPEKVAEKGK